MQNPKELLTEKLKQWIKVHNLYVEFDVLLSQSSVHGDFSSNIALIAFSQLEKIPKDKGSFFNPDKPNDILYPNPRIVAEKIVSELKENTEVNEIFEKIEIAGPGFINFYLSSNYLKNMLSEIDQKKKDYGRMDTKSTQRVMVEFGDPNPFKEIHIGHLRNFCIGESYSKLLESQGKTVIRTNYQGDVGLHVAKCLWGIMQEPAFSVQRSGVKVEDLAKGYVLGAKKYEEDENARQEIQSLNKKIYEMVDEVRQLAEEDENLKQLWEEGRKVSLEHFEELYKRIGVRYDKYYYESETAIKGKEIVESHIEDGIFEKSDGAVVFRGEKEGLHTRVFLTSQNYATYEGKDLALAILKNEDENADESVILTGNEQLEYFQVMLAALRKIAPEVEKKTKHFIFGHVRLKEGKMSSRTGDVIAASWLLDEAVSKVKKAFPEMDTNTAEKVGVGAVKYSMLKFSIPSDIHFSFEESISLEGNSGPYLLYSFVRTKSVLSKAGSMDSQETGPAAPHPHQQSSHSLRAVVGEPPVASPVSKIEKEEKDLLRFLAQFPYILAQSADDFSPNLLCNYLFELSQKFNLFYQKRKIIGSENEEFRLELTKSVGQILQNGLNILGIETVEKM